MAPLVRHGRRQFGLAVDGNIPVLASLPHLPPPRTPEGMSYKDPPPSPSPEPPKSPYEFDPAKWEHQRMAENGGVERTSYQAPTLTETLISPAAYVVSP